MQIIIFVWKFELEETNLLFKSFCNPMKLFLFSSFRFELEIRSILL